MTEVTCLVCGRIQQMWRAGDKPSKCVCGQDADLWFTWRQFIRRQIRLMRHV